MKRILTLAFGLVTALCSLQAQTSDLVFFTDDGALFTLVIDGDVKNAEPASRVVATGIRNESPMVIVRFVDASIPQMRKSGYFPLGKEYTNMITVNKKGERTLRPTGEAALGTATPTTPRKPDPATFVEDATVTEVVESPSGVTQTTTVGGVEQVTTVTVVEEESMGDGTGENVNISMGVNGVGFNMNVRVDDDAMDSGVNTNTNTTNTTVRTTTTTTTTGTMSTGKPAPAPAPAPVAPAPVKEPEVYRMPGYSGPVGCNWPMSDSEFSEAKKSIESKSFEDTRMTMAKQVGRDRCFTVDQVKALMGVFSFEDSKLDFAKYAYDRTFDIGNYYKLNDAFTFESSVDDLNTFLEAR
jgi:hypothetical protein